MEPVSFNKRGATPVFCTSLRKWRGQDAAVDTVYNEPVSHKSKRSKGARAELAWPGALPPRHFGTASKSTPNMGAGPTRSNGSSRRSPALTNRCSHADAPRSPRSLCHRQSWPAHAPAPCKNPPHTLPVLFAVQHRAAVADGTDPANLCGARRGARHCRAATRSQGPSE